MMEWLPDALNIGISEALFWNLNPRKLKPYRKAYELREKKRFEEIDYIGWLFGLYNNRAISVPIEHFACGLNKKKCDSKYYEAPISKDTRTNEQEMSEEEKIRRTKLLFASLDTMKSNFEIEKRREKGV